MEEMALVEGQLISVSDKLQAWSSWVTPVQEIMKIAGCLLKVLGVHILIILESFWTDDIRDIISQNWIKGQ